MSGKKGMRSSLKSVLPVKFGTDFAETVDGRSLLGRAVRDRIERLHQDLGGAAHLSFQQLSLCQRVVWLDLLLSNEEARIARGEGVDIPAHTQLVSSLLSVFKTLGIRRVARQAKLADYLRKGEPTTTTNG